MTDLLPCPFCGCPADGTGETVDHSAECFFTLSDLYRSDGGTPYLDALQAWNRRAPVAVAAAAKPSTCCPGEHLVPMHSTDTKLCTGCKTEKHWPLEPGQKRTY